MKTTLYDNWNKVTLSYLVEMKFILTLYVDLYLRLNRIRVAQMKSGRFVIILYIRLVKMNDAM